MPPHYYLLLAHCATKDLSAADRTILVDKVNGLGAWDVVLDYARWQGMAPLLYQHLRGANLLVSPDFVRELQISFVQSRQQNRIRLSVLNAILDIFNSAGIRVLVLKGAALSLQAYSSIGLRPMRDIDILVSPSSAVGAQESLRTLGFHASTDELEFRFNSHHHLEPAWKTVDGLFVSVEVHHALMHDERLDEEQFDRLYADSQQINHDQPFPVYTLGHEDMLVHLCQHLIQNTTVFSSPRLIWFADIVTYAEKYVVDINWHRLQKRNPLVSHILSLAHCMTPMSEEFKTHLAQHTSGMQNDIGRDFQGWPRTSLGNQMSKGWLRFLGDTFWPSEWWLRLHNGLDSTEPIWRQRIISHPFEIVSWMFHLLGHKLSSNDEEILK